MAFTKLHPRVSALAAQRFGSATPVQERAFAPVLAGKHALIIAPTGIGKTEAALLPIFSMLLGGREKRKPGVSALYITPLKALNRDLLQRIEWWAKELGITVDVRHGDTTQYQRSKQAKSPPEFLIITPETLQSILPAKIMGKHLSGIRHVVVDEIHELVESKRGTQLSIGLERLVERAGEFQRIGLSATVGSPGVTAAFLCGSREAAIIDVSLDRQLELSVELPEPTKRDNSLTKTLHILPSTVARLRRLHALVEAHKSVLTFVNTRSMAELLASRYAAWDTAKKIQVHHSSLAKDVRLVAEKSFKDGTIKGLIATSSLELGIDIGRIDLVVQYQSPRQASRLVQRVGRSGHSLGRVPKGIILSIDAEDALEAGAICEAAQQRRLEAPRPHNLALDVLAHQLVGMSMDTGHVSVEKAYAVVRRAHPYRELAEEEMLATLRQLADERYIFFDGSSYRNARPALMYYFTNVSMIPDEEKMFLRNVITRSNVGMLDESFVADNLRPGVTFITRGSPWTVLDIQDRDVLVEPATDYTSAIPDWEGEELPVPYAIAQAVGRARRTGELPAALNAASAGIVRQSIAKQKKLGFLPSDREVVIESHPGFCVIHTHFGSLVNETLGKALAALLTSMSGAPVRLRSDPYRMLIEFPVRAQPEIAKQLLLTLEPGALGGVLSSTVARSSLFRWKFVHVAKRFGLFEKGANYQRVGLRRIIEAVIDSPVHREALRDLFTEHFDLVQAGECLRQLQDGELKLTIVTPPKPSEFASFTRRASDLFLPERAEAEITAMVRSRILEAIPGLECMNCGKLFHRKVSELPPTVECPACHGTMVALLKGKEKQRVAALINAYGRRAIMALLARGVGPDQARILKRLHKTEDELFKDLLEAEKTFARTHKYWS